MTSPEGDQRTGNRTFSAVTSLLHSRPTGATFIGLMPTGRAVTDGRGAGVREARILAVGEAAADASGVRDGCGEADRAPFPPRATTRAAPASPTTVRTTTPGSAPPGRRGGRSGGGG